MTITERTHNVTGSYHKPQKRSGWQTVPCFCCLIYSIICIRFDRMVTSWINEHLTVDVRHLIMGFSSQNMQWMFSTLLELLTMYCASFCLYYLVINFVTDSLPYFYFKFHVSWAGNKKFVFLLCELNQKPLSHQSFNF